MKIEIEKKKSVNYFQEFSARSPGYDLIKVEIYSNFEPPSSAHSSPLFWGRFLPEAVQPKKIIERPGIRLKDLKNKECPYLPNPVWESEWKD